MSHTYIEFLSKIPLLKPHLTKLINFVGEKFINLIFCALGKLTQDRLDFETIMKNFFQPE